MDEVAGDAVARAAPQTPLRKGEATRRRLMEVALRLLVDRGFDDIRLDEVSAAAGLSVGAVYHHFDGKEDLFRSAARHYAELMHQEFQRRMDGVTDPGERLRRALAIVLDDPADGWLAVRRPLQVELDVPALRDVLSRLGDEWRDGGLGVLVLDALRAGSLPTPEGMDQEVIASAFMAAFVGLIRVDSTLTQDAAAERYEVFFRLFLGGLWSPLDASTESD